MSSAYIPPALRQQVAEAARHRCGYCLSAQRYVMGILEIEHIISLALGGASDESNLWLACGFCNRFKGTQISAVDPASGERVPLFNPRTQKWSEHFQWDEAGVLIIGITAIGRATVVALQLNNELAVRVRGHWVRAGWHPPTDID
ncbi:MAG: HNH endonuclease [Blastocatellales bacterium]